MRINKGLEKANIKIKDGWQGWRFKSGDLVNEQGSVYKHMPP